MKTLDFLGIYLDRIQGSTLTKMLCCGLLCKTFEGKFGDHCRICYDMQRWFCIRDWLTHAHFLSRQHFAPEVAVQAEQSLYFADFRRDPQLDPDTGEPLEVQPKFYESFPGGLADIRYPN